MSAVRLPTALLLFLLVAALSVPGSAGILPAPLQVAAGEQQIKQAAAEALKLLQSSIGTWQQKQDCVSCHHEILPLMAFRVAREHGVPLDEAAARETARRTFSFLRDLDRAVQYTHIIDPYFDAYTLLAAHSAGIPASLSTAVYARLIARRQTADGRWTTIDVRPPQAHGGFTATAVALRALQLYMPAQLAAETQERVARARRWLLSATPLTTEHRAFQLLGLGWAGAGSGDLRRLAEALSAEQRSDGGWAQLPSRDSDAYSTGEVLVALHEAGGVPTGDPAYQRGLRFLLNSQLPDGSWLAPTRLLSPAPVSPPYMETGYPHGKHQMISAMAASWAVMALSLPLRRADPPAALLATGDLAPPAEAWMETALFGSAAELRSRLDRGLDPNSKTAGGTTPLMMAAADPDKVKLLLDGGARVNDAAKTGFTALMVASQYKGNAAAVRLLLGKGARVKFGPRDRILFDASPLFLAAATGDSETAALLLEKGAVINHKMVLLGMIATPAAMMASFGGETGTVELLLRRGAKVNEPGPDGMTMLSWAVLGDHPRLVRTLIGLGARVNQVDKYGMTPLLYAATMDFGNTEVARALLEAGADTSVRTKEGANALDQARKHNHQAIQALLDRAVAAR